mmetsp:Transcript_22433/g.48833  ORF Transcript_22433/g.48833 Transcript_22433/m.48833 type:complete len:142 (+) Transcript_22433:70-495(+)
MMMTGVAVGRKSGCSSSKQNILKCKIMKLNPVRWIAETKSSMMDCRKTYLVKRKGVARRRRIRQESQQAKACCSVLPHGVYLVEERRFKERRRIVRKLVGQENLRQGWNVVVAAAALQPGFGGEFEGVRRLSSTEKCMGRR